MALAFLDRRAQEEGLSIELLYKEGTKPDPEMIEAVMHAMHFGTWAPCDERRKLSRLSDTVREACFHREPDYFLPPKRLLPDGKANDYKFPISAKLFWREVADLLLWKGQQEVFSDTQIAALRAQTRLGVTNIHRNYSIRDKRENLYFDYETADQSAEDLIQEISALENDMKARLKKAVEGVMRNRKAMEEIQHTASVHRQVVLEVVLKDQIGFLEYVRSQVENTEQRVMLTTMLQTAVRSLGIDDLDMELLSARDALFYGCDGLYTPAHKDERAKVSVPMSRYGTTHLLELDDILKTLAHEIAHHLIAKAKLRKIGGEGKYDRYRVEVLPGDWLSFPVPKGTPAAETWIREGHHLAHTSTTRVVQQALEGMHFGWKDQVGPVAPAWLVQVQARTSRPMAPKTAPASASAPAPSGPAPAAPPPWWKRWLR